MLDTVLLVWLLVGESGRYFERTKLESLRGRWLRLLAYREGRGCRVRVCGPNQLQAFVLRTGCALGLVQLYLVRVVFKLLGEGFRLDASDSEVGVTG